MQIYLLFTYNKRGDIVEVNCYSSYEKAEKRIEKLKKYEKDYTYEIQDGELDWGV